MSKRKVEAERLHVRMTRETRVAMPRKDRDHSQSLDRT